MNIYKSNNCNDWYDKAHLYPAYNIFKNENEDMDEFLKRLIDSNMLTTADVDENNVWDLCAYGMKTLAVKAFKSNQEKNGGRCPLIMAKREVDKIMGVKED